MSTLSILVNKLFSVTRLGIPRRFPRSVTPDRSIQNVWRTRESFHDTSILRKPCHSSPNQSNSELRDTPPYTMYGSRLVPIKMNHRVTHPIRVTLLYAALRESLPIIVSRYIIGRGSARCVLVRLRRGRIELSTAPAPPAGRPDPSKSTCPRGPRRIPSSNATGQTPVPA